jgi:hypothetical protein
MPYLIVNKTREIVEIDKRPEEGRWVNVNIPCRRLLSCHQYDIEWGYMPAFGLKDMDTGDVILDYRDMAYDVEYYYRGSDDIAYSPGFPNSVKFS